MEPLIDGRFREFKVFRLRVGEARAGGDRPRLRDESE